MLRMKWAVPVVAGTLMLAGCGAEEGLEEGAATLEQGVEETAGVVETGAEGLGDAAGLGEWDTDADRRLAVNEFGGWAEREGIFDRWDADTEAGINNREFGEGALGVWDTDNDMRLAENEWNEGVGGWFENENYGTFADWDLNDDTFLDGNELGEGFNRTGLFGDWDLNDNNLLESNEWNEGVFGVWDENDDTFVDENEWNAEFAGWRA